MTIKQREAGAKRTFKTAAQGRLNIKLVENQVGSGTPDSIIQNMKGGAAWIEFKALENWPIRPGTLPLKNAFEKGQIPFLKEWQSWSGHGYVILSIKPDRYYEWFLLNPKAFPDITEATRTELVTGATAKGLENIIAFLENI